MENFTVQEHNGNFLHYAKPLTNANWRLAVEAFSQVIDEIPDPVFTWIDGKADDIGPNDPRRWELEVTHDQETDFHFTTSALSASAFHEFVEEIEEIIRTDTQNRSFDDSGARFNLVFAPTIRFNESDEYDHHCEITYRIRWKLAE